MDTSTMPGTAFSRRRRRSHGTTPTEQPRRSYGQSRRPVGEVSTSLDSLEGFETVERSLREDKLRIDAIRSSLADGRDPQRLETKRVIRPTKSKALRPTSSPIDGEAAERLIKKLQSNVASEGEELTLSSSLAMRRIRQRVIGALLHALKHHPNSDLQTFTILNEQWVFTPEQLNSITAKSIKNQFRSHLERAGVLGFPGPFIAFLHGEFEPTKEVYVLHFHGVTTAKKAEALRGLKTQPGYVQSDTGAAAIKIQNVNDRASQFSYLIKSYWPQKAVRKYSDGKWRRDRKPSRITGLFQIRCLLWLDRQELGNLTIMSGCWSPRNGGPPASRALYLSIFSRRLVASE
jgi:hypothetical protein